jgi:hypothetical protein
MSDTVVRVQDVLSLRWEEHRANPLVHPPRLSWLIADPTFLPPECTPDRRWHLFAHSLSGIHHYVSSDGLSWEQQRARVVGRGAARAFLFYEPPSYYLFYEHIVSVRFPSYVSRIEACTSTDLQVWGDPVVVLEPSLAWQRDGSWAGNVGNPCVVREAGNCRLFFSSGLVYLKDCAFCEPKYVGCAASAAPLGPYTYYPHPLLAPQPDDAYANLGAGAVKVLRCEDGWVGFQNGIYWDPAQRHSGSAIRLLQSENGLDWHRTGPPILTPDRGWKKSHVYGLDVRRTSDGWRLYFNARSGWLLGWESVGLARGV